MIDPSIATAEYEGRKIGMQLFYQAKEDDTFHVFPFLVKKLMDPMIDITFRNFTCPSVADREESGSVYSWSHTQRLDYNFFTGMRSEVVGLVKAWRLAQQPVPESCRGGLDHLVQSSYTPTVTMTKPIPQQTPSQNETMPPIFGGVQLQATGDQQFGPKIKPKQFAGEELMNKEREDPPKVAESCLVQSKARDEVRPDDTG